MRSIWQKNDAVAVLHATLDYRRIIDVPGYEKIDLHPATRFIGTMNYGYAGTKELNEALVSRFLVIYMPALTEERSRRSFIPPFRSLKKKQKSSLPVFFWISRKKRITARFRRRPLTFAACWQL